MFEVGRLVAKIALDGAQTFGRDLKAVGNEFTGLSDKGRKAAGEVGSGMQLMGAGILAVVGLAVAKFAEFDRAMSEVQAGTHASASDMALLRQAAIDMGAGTSFSATEAAGAITELGKAGVSTKDILGGGLKGSLDLAAAGQISVADAAAIAATAMTQFRLEGAQIPHVADLLAAGAGKAQGSVDDLGMALNQSGLVAGQMGLSVEQTVGTLAAFASAGLKGSDAGTSFKTMLLALANPSKEASALLDKYKISVYDANGAMRSTSDIAGQLQTAFEGKTQAEKDSAMATIFGSDAIRAANVLYDQGAEGIQGWTDKVNDAGYASSTAAMLTDNLSGDVEKLGGAFDTALIQSGEGANGVLRNMVQALTGLIDAYSGLPPFIQQGTLVVAGFAGAALLAAGTLLTVIPKIAEFRSSVALLSGEMPKTTAGLKAAASFMAGPWGMALGAAFAALMIGLSALQQYNDEVDALSSSLDQNTGALTSNSRAAIAKQLQDKGIADAAKGLGLSLDTITSAAMGNSKAMAEVKAAQDKYNSTLGTTASLSEGVWEGFGGAVSSNVVGALEEVGGQMDKAQKKTRDLAGATDESAESQTTAAGAYLEASGGAEELLGTLDQLIAKIDEANGKNSDAVSANADYRQALAGMTTEVERNRAAFEEATGSSEGFSLSLDENTAAGSANASSLTDVADKARGAAAAQYEVDKTTMSARDATNKYVDTLGVNRQAFIDGAVAAGYNGTEVQALADKVFALPTQREIDILANTSAAASAVDDLVARLNQRVATITVRAAMPDINGPVSGNGQMGTFADGASVEYYAGGGQRENHVAQIAAAGTRRVWAEPETEGEGYIPFALSKRARSTAILDDIAGRFGYDLVATGTQSGGGVALSGINSSTGATVNLNVYPSKGMDEDAFIEKIMRKLEKALNKK